MKTIWKILGGLVIILAIAFAGGIGKIVGKSATESYYAGKKEATIDAALLHTASEMNKTLPMMVDAETRLDSTTGINRTIRYNYTMVNYTVADLDPAQFKQSMEPTIVNKVCTTKEMQVFVRNKVPVSFAYYDKQGKQITVITVPSSSCEQAS
jgi:hypothetical protein